MKTRFAVLAAALALMISFPAAVQAVGLGKQCGGFVFPSNQCDPGLFCQKKAGACFVIDVSGTCAKVPRFCFKATSPRLKVCGCDGKTYNNDCERQQAMVSLSHKGACK